MMCPGLSFLFVAAASAGAFAGRIAGLRRSERRAVCAESRPAAECAREHARKVERIATQLRERRSSRPLSLRKRAVSHLVPRRGDSRLTDDKIDVRDLNAILEIDPARRICVAEPGVTFLDLVAATMRYGLVPIVVPELETITVGGAVADCSIESMSFKRGGFHDTCLEYEVITGRGEVLTCAPEGENRLVFQMMHGSFGTLGILSKLTFELLPAKELVRVESGGIKTLISHNYYSEDDFWKTWNRSNYEKVKARTDPDDVFRDLYTKTCKAAMGVQV